jgi:hypothetical protein
LNKNEFVLRLINLHDHKVIKVPKFGLNSWKLTEVGLNLVFTQIRESFAQGEAISQRKEWKNIPNEVNISNSGQLDQFRWGEEGELIVSIVWWCRYNVEA